MKSRKEKLLSALYDFLIVFASVVLALLANDWRENRNLHQQELEVLQQLANELDADAENMELYLVRLRQQQEGAAVFVSHLRNDAPEDSLLRSSRLARGIWNYKPTYPTYQGLSRSGGLSLISDNELRSAIIYFHDDGLDLLRDRLAGIEREYQELDQRMRPYFGNLPNDSLHWEQQFHGSKRALQNDAGLQVALGALMGLRRVMEAAVRDWHLQENRALSQRIKDHIASNQ